MQPRHVLLALVVTLLWGANFVVIRLGLDSFPPLLLAALRFVLAALPALFLPRPDIGWGRMIALGLAWFVGQFSLLFLGMAVGMPPGVASVVLQSQVFFTILLAALTLGERPRRVQGLGTLVALAGLGLIGITAGTGGVTPAGFGLLLAAAFCWSTGNILMRGAGRADMLGLIAWLSLIPPVPLLALSWVFEGPERIGGALTHLNWTGVGSVVYLTVFATFIGYGGWGALLKRYPAGTVAPFSLLIPVFGAACAWLALGETFGPQRLTGMGLILAGLAVVVLPDLRLLGRLRSGVFPHR
ncbi:putative amino-acid metabolite efflux pump [Fundidesulfovibrio magnetotacticus]|uniref:Putative amino-acid metabolite efflux pump n=1 Tax=Fundidesulfovibrio magnetotacticus TaxID=2730080 RepID=A0A6V8LVR5_9BACT|nr:EamA family transporter [Fundidesulfovibrio magnetotacticus]GFK94681.1 putative amino-acid metabolite efflux pump [Fundidesulfovibrio magnetotacticus]